MRKASNPNPEKSVFRISFSQPLTVFSRSLTPQQSICCGYGTSGSDIRGYDCLSIPGAKTAMGAGTMVAPSRICGRKSGIVTMFSGPAATICCKLLPRYLPANIFKAFFVFQRPERRSTLGSWATTTNTLATRRWRPRSWPRDSSFPTSKRRRGASLLAVLRSRLLNAGYRW